MDYSGVLQMDGSDSVRLTGPSGIASYFGRNTGRASKILFILLLGPSPPGWGDAPSCEAAVGATDAPSCAKSVAGSIDCDHESDTTLLVLSA